MLQRILAPLDGSARAERALPPAACLARACGGSLILVRVVPSFPPLTAYGGAPPSPPIPLTEDNLAGHATEAHDYLAAVAGRDDLRPLAVQTVVRVGSPGPEICDIVAATRADQIVLCSRGRTGLTRWALGSIADKVARSSPVPALVQREGGPVPPTGAPVSVLVPLDGSPTAEAALDPALALVRTLAGEAGGRLRLVLALGVPPSHSGGTPGDAADDAHRASAMAAARAYLATTAERLRREAPADPPLEVTADLIFAMAFGYDVAEAIIRVAEGAERAANAGSVDAVAMATHGLGGLQHWVMGSITERVLHSSKLPLLVVRPAGAAVPGPPGAGEGSEVERHRPATA